MSFKKSEITLENSDHRIVRKFKWNEIESDKVNDESYIVNIADRFLIIPISELKNKSKESLLKDLFFQNGVALEP